MGFRSSSALVNDLHECYVARTGYEECLLNMSREATWGDWLRYRPVEKRFTVEDLKRVIGWLKGKVRDGWDERALAFRNLIGDPEKFEEYLSEAKGSIRQAPPAGPSPVTRYREPAPVKETDKLREGEFDELFGPLKRRKQP